MATKTIDKVDVGSTATQVVAANVNRKALAFRVVTGMAFFGASNSVTPATGFPWSAEDGPFLDEIPATDALYAIVPVGKVEVRYWEVTA